MNTITFTVGLDRGRYIQRELESFPGNKSNWEFEVTNEEDMMWMRVTIKDISSLDALMIFHAGVEAGEASVRK